MSDDQRNLTALPLKSLPCGCKATACGTGWCIDAEAFLCTKRHKQGAVISYIVFDDIDHNAECIRNALRKLGRFDRLDEDGTARAAGEALGFFVHKARKEGEHG